MFHAYLYLFILFDEEDNFHLQESLRASRLTPQRLQEHDSLPAASNGAARELLAKNLHKAVSRLASLQESKSESQRGEVGGDFDGGGPLGTFLRSYPGGGRG